MVRAAGDQYHYAPMGIEPDFTDFLTPAPDDRPEASSVRSAQLWSGIYRAHVLILRHAE